MKLQLDLEARSGPRGGDGGTSESDDQTVESDADDATVGDGTPAAEGRGGGVGASGLR